DEEAADDKQRTEGKNRRIEEGELDHDPEKRHTRVHEAREHDENRERFLSETTHAPGRRFHAPLGAQDSAFPISRLRNLGLDEHRADSATYSRPRAAANGICRKLHSADASNPGHAGDSVRGGRSREARPNPEAGAGTRRCRRTGPRRGSLPDGPPPPR